MRRCSSRGRIGCLDGSRFSLLLQWSHFAVGVDWRGSINVVVCCLATAKLEADLVGWRPN